ncbi:MAG: hypothetical protein R3D30_08740 [Hyphomicrobiales bacterium]
MSMNFRTLLIRLLGIFSILGAALCAPALAEPLDLKDLAAHPENYLGQEVELEGFCVKGGRSGDVLGYECITDDGVYVDAGDIAPDSAKQKLADICGVKHSDDCRATIRFSPRSYTTSAVIEPGKDVVVFNADKVDVTF